MRQALCAAGNRATMASMRRTMTVLALAGGMTGGCVTINAPDKPIVINLNIAITQEVVYRLDGEAKALIQQNPGTF